MLHTYDVAVQMRPASRPKSKNAFNADSAAWQSNLRGDATFVTDAAGNRPDWFWTGRKPVPGTPGVLSDGTVTSLPLPDLSSCTRQQVLDYFDNSWLITEIVFSGLQGEEAFYRPPFHNLRHPKIFYYAHPAVLYVNKLRIAGLLDAPVNADFEHIFETGVDEMSWDDLSKNEMVWPAVRDVTEYRREVYTRVRRVIETCAELDDGAPPVAWESRAWAIFMAIEHEKIHIETSSVLIRELPASLVRKPKWWPSYHPELHSRALRPNDMIEVAGRDVAVGKPLDWPSFGWDNEYGRRVFQCRTFRASRCLISNAEMLEFVAGGGYIDSAMWTEEGWKWRTFRNVKWPSFWVLDGPAGLHQYKLRLIWEVVDMPMAAPAIVNFHEAKAYCAWRSRKDGLRGDAAYRLTTEIEQKVIRLGTLEPFALTSKRATADPVMTLSGAEMRALANSNLAWGAESPVDASAATPAGFHDAFGNAWQWCEDYLASLPDSHGIHTYYEDFSTPCYDGQHNVIVGGSFMSTGDEASVFARFHFRPHFHQHASFRIVRGTGRLLTTDMDSPPPHVGSWNPVSNPVPDALDTAAAVALKMLTHYPCHAITDPLSGILAITALQFPQQASRAVADMCDACGIERRNLLELGCSVGGCTFRFAEHFAHVVAVDLEAQMINAAKDMQDNGLVVVRFKEEGRYHSQTTIARPVPSDISARIEFRQMDPCCIAPDIGSYEVVVINDILDRIASPKSPLGRMGGLHGIVKPGGLLMIIAADDWDPRISDPKLWLGGREDGKSSRAGLESQLGSEFTCIAEQEMQYVMREHARKFSLVLANATIWRRQPL